MLYSSDLVAITRYIRFDVLECEDPTFETNLFTDKKSQFKD